MARLVGRRGLAHEIGIQVIVIIHCSPLLHLSRGTTRAHLGRCHSSSSCLQRVSRSLQPLQRQWRRRQRWNSRRAALRRQANRCPQAYTQEEPCKALGSWDPKTLQTLYDGHAVQA